MKLPKAEIKNLYDLKNVLCDQEWLKTAKNFEVYFIYRGVKKENGLRYDITKIPTKMFGKEFPKTKGHIHQNKFTELITVLEGKAFYLRQKGKGTTITDAVVVEAKKGEFVVIPKGYDHLTINPSRKELRMANWISPDCKNDYSFFEKMHGACYFYTKSGWIKNKNYKKVPALRFEKALNRMPENLEFLKGIK